MAGAEEPAPLLGSAVESHTRAGICHREARRAWTCHRGSSAPPGKAVEGAPPGRAARSLRQAPPGAPSAGGRPARTGRPRRRAPLRQRQGRPALLGSSVHRGGCGAPPGRKPQSSVASGKRSQRFGEGAASQGRPDPEMAPRGGLAAPAALYVPTRVRRSAWGRERTMEKIGSHFFLTQQM
jgi:hypothetical protein